MYTSTIYSFMKTSITVEEKRKLLLLKKHRDLAFVNLPPPPYITILCCQQLGLIENIHFYLSKRYLVICAAFRSSWCLCKIKKVMHFRQNNCSVTRITEGEHYNNDVPTYTLYGPQRAITRRRLILIYSCSLSLLSFEIE